MHAAALHAGYGDSPPPAPNLTGTTHVSVVDARGDAAALSTTLGSGSGLFRGGCQLNNMLGELDVIGDTPQPPGQRLPSMMAPTLVLAGDRPRLALGSAGSVRLAGAIVQVVAAVAGRGEQLDEAIAAPRIHVDGDGRVHLEGGRPETDAEHLTAESWEVVRWAGRNLFFGGVAAVELLADGSLAAAGDPRRGGHGIVVT
jgi:gamma-glutamyltranspeptidase/glutathione hydrolase